MNFYLNLILAVIIFLALNHFLTHKIIETLNNQYSEETPTLKWDNRTPYNKDGKPVLPAIDWSKHK